MTQGHIMAAAIASSATVDTGSIVIDPDKLIETERQRPARRRSVHNLDFPINPERAGPVLRRLVPPPTAPRPISVAASIDREGLLVVDSRYLYGRGDIAAGRACRRIPKEQQGRSHHRAGTRSTTGSSPTTIRVQKEYGLDNGKDFPEVTAALNGASVSVVRVNDENEIIVSVAVPIQRFRAVLGTLVLSTTRRRDRRGPARRTADRAPHLPLRGAGHNPALGVCSPAHIAEPIRRLPGAAERVRRGVNNRVEIPDFTQRRDEIGHLSGALRDMTDALYNRIDAIEAFAADVSHELKNPLTSLRSAVETLPYARPTSSAPASPASSRMMSAASTG